MVQNKIWTTGNHYKEQNKPGIRWFTVQKSLPLREIDIQFELLVTDRHIRQFLVEDNNVN